MRWCDGLAAAAQVVACVGLVLALAVQHRLDTTRNEPIELTLWWMAPFYSSGGYCSEAVAFALSLQDRMSMRISQHGTVRMAGDGRSG